MHSKSDNKNGMTGFATEELIEEPFKSIFHRYLVGLKQSMKDSKFVIDHADELQLHNKCHKTNLNRVSSNIDSP